VEPQLLSSVRSVVVDGGGGDEEEGGGGEMEARIIVLHTCFYFLQYCDMLNSSFEGT
jgi:hypothetical protein